MKLAQIHSQIDINQYDSYSAFIIHLVSASHASCSVGRKKSKAPGSICIQAMAKRSWIRPIGVVTSSALMKGSSEESEDGLVRVHELEEMSVGWL